MRAATNGVIAAVDRVMRWGGPWVDAEKVALTDHVKAWCGKTSVEQMVLDMVAQSKEPLRSIGGYLERATGVPNRRYLLQGEECSDGLRLAWRRASQAQRMRFALVGKGKRRHTWKDELVETIPVVSLPDPVAHNVVVEDSAARLARNTAENQKVEEFVAGLKTAELVTSTEREAELRVILRMVARGSIAWEHAFAEIKELFP